MIYGAPLPLVARDISHFADDITLHITAAEFLAVLAIYAHSLSQDYFSFDAGINILLPRRTIYGILKASQRRDIAAADFA